MSRPKLVLMGRSSGSFGLKGEVRVYPFTGDAKVFSRGLNFYAGANPETAQVYVLGAVRRHKERLLFTIEGIDDKTKADEFKGTHIYLAEDALPALNEDEYYWFELYGAEVRDTSNKLLGHIRNVTEIGAQEMWIVRNEQGKEAMIPCVDEFVREMNVAEGVLIVDLPEGLLESQGWDDQINNDES